MAKPAQETPNAHLREVTSLSVAKYRRVMGGRRAAARAAARPTVRATALVVDERDLGLARRFTLGVMVVVLQVGDLVTTRKLLDVGGQETNPLARFLMASGRFEATKIALAGVVGVLILIAPLRRRTQWVVVGVVVLYSLLLVFHAVELSGTLSA